MFLVLRLWIDKEAGAINNRLCKQLNSFQGFITDGAVSLSYQSYLLRVNLKSFPGVYHNIGINIEELKKLHINTI